MGPKGGTDPERGCKIEWCIGLGSMTQMKLNLEWGGATMAGGMYWGKNSFGP